MEPVRINIDDWEKAGGGASGWMYFSKTDDSVILKLNKEEIPMEVTLDEYITSRSLYETGIPCAKVHEFVTDGVRYGMTVERLKDKRSYVRMIADNPDMLEPVARDFARRAKEFHSTVCDTSKFESKKMRCRKAFEKCDAIPADVKEYLYSCLDSMDDLPNAVHGDFTPGNIVRSQGRDYWIDLGQFAYGDPDFDVTCLVFLARYTPKKVVEYLFHITRKQVGQFLEIYGQEYYGDRWHSKELEEKIGRLMPVKVALSITDSPPAAKMYLPLVRGHKFRFAIMLKIADVLIRKFN